MGLFSTLADAQTDARSNKSSSNLPTVVQLYTKDPVRLEPLASCMPSYALLSYSAVPCASSSALTSPSNNNTGSNKTGKLFDPVPDLGVWNVRVLDDTTTCALALLPASTSKTCTTFVWTVDLSTPTTLEPTMTLLQNALIRHLKQQKGDDGTIKTLSNTSTDSATTSLFELQTTRFGLALEDSLTTTTIEPDVKDRETKICLIIVAQHTTKSSASTAVAAEETQYYDQQVQALLKYHLYKFASQLNAYLVFVGSETSNDMEEEAISSSTPTHTPEQVAVLLKDLAQNLPIRNAVHVSAAAAAAAGDSPGDTDDAPVLIPDDASLSIYAPDNADVIDSVILRNANFPGQWDAGVTSLWKILPPPPPTASSRRATPSVSVGDQSWLKELHDSVAAVDKTPIKSAKKEPSAAENRTSLAGSKEADASSFFASLLS
jgi:hypothetical protein